MAHSTTHQAETGPKPTNTMPSRSMLVFDRDAARAVDQAAVRDFGIPGIVLMENAARGVADQAMHMVAGDDPASIVLIICGGGNNGGDGFAAARHLHNRGVNICLACTDEPRPGTDARINFEICRKMKLPQIQLAQLYDHADAQRFSLIIDALFGTGLDRPVAGPTARVIEWINAAGRPVLAVDLPSGMDCNTGKPQGAVVKASRTVTFLGWKAGFLNLDAQKLLGEIVVADIGAPIELLERLGRRIEAAYPESPEKSMGRDQPRRGGRPDRAST